jgi:hypothetical protein
MFMRLTSLKTPLLLALICLAFPATFFALLGRWIYLMRPVFNIDYLLAGAALAFLPVWLGSVLFGLVLFNDLIYNIAPIYHFQITDVFLSLEDLRHVNLLEMAPILFGVFVTGVLIAALSGRFLAPLGRSNRKATVAVLVSCALLVSAVDILNGTSFLPLRISRSFMNFNFAYSGARSTYKAFNEASFGSLNLSPLSPEQSATGHSGFADSLQGENLLLVVVESLGSFQDETLDRELFSLVSKPEIAAKYEISFGRVPFVGHTIQGEFRELCGVLLHGMGKGEFPDCLPSRLRRKGYRSFGAHGFTNQFYRRYQWYPRLGFDEALLAEDLRQANLSSSCGSGFSGLCDGEMLDWARAKLTQGTDGKPVFVYLLTLNSHHPVSAKNAEGSRYSCESNARVAENPEVCLHNRILARVLDGIVSLALAPELPRTRILIVGDHAPPFLGARERALYRQDVVPYYSLSPR